MKHSQRPNLLTLNVFEGIKALFHAFEVLRLLSFAPSERFDWFKGIQCRDEMNKSNIEHTSNWSMMDFRRRLYQHIKCDSNIWLILMIGLEIRLRFLGNCQRMLITSNFGCLFGCFLRSHKINWYITWTYRTRISALQKLILWRQRIQMLWLHHLVLLLISFRRHTNAVDIHIRLHVIVDSTATLHTLMQWCKLMLFDSKERKTFISVRLWIEMHYLFD